MGAYIYTLKGPKHSIKVNINGVVENVALMSFHYKPISIFWDGDPPWQRLAKARCARMANVWRQHGFPKYVCHVFVEKDGSIDFSGNQVFEWPYQNDASICDSSGAYEKRKHVGYLKHKYHDVWELTV